MFNLKLFNLNKFFRIILYLDKLEEKNFVETYLVPTNTNIRLLLDIS